MKNRGIRALPALLAALLLTLSLPALAAGEAEDPQWRELSTREDLLTLADDPAGHYRLTADVDMAGVDWTPVDFTGVLDGGGHALLNLTVTRLSEGVETTYDGNYKEYDTSFAGLFGTLKGAQVYDLSLVNLRVTVTTDLPCFLGGVAGYMENSTIRSCAVSGILDLTAHDRMFGVGGVIGYGNGSIEDTAAYVTLICTDTDAETRDEQFLGGLCAAGYPELVGCSVDLEGYISDHGYVHSGGLVGMYIFYPRGLDHWGTVTDNTLRGRITFFEDNTNRRAYCDQRIGEIMNWDFTNGRNTYDFVRNEVFDYSVDLRPEMCAQPTYTETVTPPGCDSFGYTTYVCDSCGYTYTDHYTLYQHTVTHWTTTLAPTVETTGLEEGPCDLCGTVLTRELARLDPPEETPPPEEPPQPTLPPAAQPAPRKSSWVPLALGGAALALLAGCAVALTGRKKRR